MILPTDEHGVEKVVILGKSVGFCTGWDLVCDDGNEEVYYNFRPIPNNGLPCGDLFVNYGKGTFDYYDDLGQIVISYPICKTA